MSHMEPSGLGGSLGRLGIGLALVGATVFALVDAGNAEPWIAQREGLHCARCHVNRSGGGKRTAFGQQYGLTHLAVRPAAQGPAGAQGPMPDPNLNEHASIGANLRLGHRTLFAKEVHNSLVSREANIYLDLQPWRALTLYTDISLAEGSVEPREVFALVEGPAGTWLRAGYLLPPFGLRFWDDEAFTRSETGFTFADPDLAAEFGWQRGDWLAQVAISNGAGGGIDGDNHKRLSGLFEWATRPLRVGLSAAFNEAGGQRRLLGGLYLGTSLGRLVLLGEVDWLHTTYLRDDVSVDGLVARVEADLALARGVNLQLAYGYHDPALDVAEDQRIRLRAALEVFVIPLVAGRLVYDMGQSVPQDEVGNADALLVELHAFF